MKIIDNRGRWDSLEEWHPAEHGAHDTFLLTRFNLKMCWHTKSGLDSRSDKWLQQRMELFADYCWPSVRQQTCGDFMWLCLLADDTPQCHVDRLETLARECRQMVIVMMDEEEGRRHREMVTTIIDHVRKPGHAVITLRVDNDDILRNDFIERARGYAQRQEENMVMYWFADGLQLYSKERKVFSLCYGRNQFPFLVNRVCRNGDPTILSYSHAAPETSCVKRVIRDGRPMWMENVHDDNVVNDVMFTTRQRPFGMCGAMYDAFLPAVRRDICTRWYHVLTFLVPRMARQFCIRLARKLSRRS